MEVATPKFIAKWSQEENREEHFCNFGKHINIISLKMYENELKHLKTHHDKKIIFKRNNLN